MTDYPMYYRVRESVGADGVCIVVERWKVTRETPKCYWIVRENLFDLLKENGGWKDFASARRAKQVRRVSKGSVDHRYCAPSLKEAMRDFKRRKEIQLIHVTLTMQCVELAISKFDEYANLPDDAFPCFDGFNIGMVPQIDNFRWD